MSRPPRAPRGARLPASSLLAGLAGLLCLLLLLAGCGGTDSSTGTAPAANTAAASSPATSPPSPAASAASTSAAASEPAADFPITVRASNGPVTLPARPERIVSLTPTATEMLFAIGAGEQVEAVDDQSNYPPQAPKTDLSGFKPNVEAITRYDPDLVVVSDDTGGLVAALGKLRIPVLLTPAATTLEDSYAQIEQLGAATGHVADAAGVVADMQRRLDEAVRATPKRPDVSVYHELDPSYFSATSRTFIGSLYAKLGLTNIADKAPKSAGDYPKLSAESVVAANPDLIVLADGKCCQQSAETVAARPGFSKVAAVRTGSVVAIDDDIASRWGPRVPDFLAQVAAAVAKVPAGATTG